MEYILRSIHQAGMFGWLYIASLFFGFHFFAVHYIHSSFLEQHLTQSDVGVLYAVGSSLALLLLGVTGFILRRVGNYNTALLATTLNFGATLGLACATEASWILVFFVIHLMLAPITLFTFDVFLEAKTTDENTTGSVRGTFLSIGVLATLFAPVISGFIAGEASAYHYVYLVSALYLLPVFVILNMRFRTFADPHYETLTPIRAIRHMWEHRNIFRISVSQFLLRFFFSWYVVYLPIYLHQNIGFSWPEIGTILFIMLVPYVLFTYPAGLIADRVLGEKEMLIAGFIIAGVATAGLFFLNEASLLLWSAVLFVTRIGATLMESMTETYFFRQINGDHASIISIFRMLRPLGYILGPLTAGVLLLIMSLQYLWLILAGIMFLGALYALSLQDSR